MRVDVIRSKRRKKTAQATLLADDHVRVLLPGWVRPEDEAAWVQPLVDRLARRVAQRSVDLTERAALLARRYRLPEPASIRWVSNQGKRWGSCTPSTGEIRISDRLADGGVPQYVLDYVVVHELAHLRHADHSAAFKALEARFPRVERANGYLEALGRLG
jgi:predicted metal-dependent hydrolase